MARQPLTEQYQPAERLRIVEDVEGGVLRARGPFADIAIPTKNKRRYGLKLWENAIDKIRPLIEKRAVAGHLDHPKDGKTSIPQISHMVTDLAIVEDSPGSGTGIIEGELTVFSTPHGQILKTLIREGLLLGVSSRGAGTLKKLPDGTEEVSEDYLLKTFDVVVDPAALSAYPTFVNESMEDDMTLVRFDLSEGEDDTLEELRKRFPVQMDAHKTAVLLEARESLAREIAGDIIQIKEAAFQLGVEQAQKNTGASLAESITAALIPIIQKVPAPVVDDKEHKALVDQLAALTGEKVTLEKSLKESEDSSRVLSLQLHLERSLHGVENKADVEKFIGDVKVFESVDALQKRIDDYADTVGIKKIADKQAASVKSLKEAARIASEGKLLAEREAAALKKKHGELAESVTDIKLSHTRLQVTRGLDESLAASLAPLLESCKTDGEIIAAAAAAKSAHVPSLKLKTPPRASLMERVVSSIRQSSASSELTEASGKPDAVDQRQGHSLQEELGAVGIDLQEALALSTGGT